jgi:hypothetical protein
VSFLLLPDNNDFWDHNITIYFAMKKYKREIQVLVIIGLMIILVSSCANKEIVAECLKGHTYGFWGGLWHGIIAPIDLIGMLIYDDVTMFAENNNGAWYAFGFLIGSGGWGLLGGRGFKKR